MSQPLTCDQAQLLLSSLLARACDAEEAAALDRHLKACRDCAAVGAEMAVQDLDFREFVVRSSFDATARLEDALGQAAAPADLPVRRSRRWVRGGGSRPASPGWKAGLAAAGLFVASVLFLTMTSSEPPLRTDVARSRKESREAEARSGEDKAARARDARQRLESELADREQERRRLEEARKQAKDEKERAELQAREADLAKAAEEFRARVAAAKKRQEEAEAEVAKAAEASPDPATPPRNPVPPSRETLASIGRIEKVQDAVAMSGGEKVRLKGGEPLLAGQSIQVGENGSAVVLFEDKTRLEFGPHAEVRDFKADGGKRLFIVRGTVSANVEKQPKGQDMVFLSPHGEARVLGTRLRLTVDPGPKASTVLEVSEGKVQLRNLAGRTVDVPTGYYAVAAAGVELSAKPTVDKSRVESFTLINADAGLPIAEFDPIRDGAVLNLSRLPTRNLNIRANVSPRKVGCVRFSLDGVENYRIERALRTDVYSLAGDLNGRFDAWTPAPGDHSVTATPYADPEMKEPPGTPLTIRFRVVAR